MWVGDKLIERFNDCLQKRRQRVVIPGSESPVKRNQSGVCQGSIIGSLPFLLYINNIVNEIRAEIKLIADDKSLFPIVDNPNNAAEILQSDIIIYIYKIVAWSWKWLVTFTPSKTENLLVSQRIAKGNHPTLYMSN